MIDTIQSPSPCAIMSSIPLHPSDISQKGMFLIASLAVFSKLGFNFPFKISIGKILRYFVLYVEVLDPTL